MSISTRLRRQSDIKSDISELTISDCVINEIEINLKVLNKLTIFPIAGTNKTPSFYKKILRRYQENTKT